MRLCIPAQSDKFFEFLLAQLKLDRGKLTPKKFISQPYTIGIDDIRRPSKTWIKVKNPKAPAATRAIDGTFQ
jgi:hypothetical protein